MRQGQAGQQSPVTLRDRILALRVSTSPGGGGGGGVVGWGLQAPTVQAKTLKVATVALSRAITLWGQQEEDLEH